MQISIDASGPREKVKHAVGAQADAARREFANSQPLVAALSDEIARRIRNAPGTEFKVSAMLVIDIDVTKITDADKSEPAVFINGERVTKDTFERMLVAEQVRAERELSADTLIGTEAVGEKTGLIDSGH